MKKVLIVGGSKGIGHQLLNQLIENHLVISISRTHIPFEHPNLIQYNLDVLHAQLPEISELDALVYCPGSINLKPFNRLSMEDFHSDYEVNVIGALRVMQHYLPVLKKSEEASVVLFSSIAVQTGMPFHASIAMAKGAIEALTRSLAAEYIGKIRFNAIAPTLTNTSLAAGILKNEQAIENAKNRHPLKAFLEAEDVANMANYLISSLSQKVTGQIFTLDCGLSTLKV